MPRRAPGPRCRFARSSFSVPLREKTRALMTMPPTPGGTLERAVADVAGLLAEDGSKELLLGGELRLALRGDLADQDVARVAPRRRCGRCPLSSRSFRASSPTFGMSRVISSLPSFVSRATHSNSSMWIEVKTSSFAMRSRDEDRVLEVVALPWHERDEHVLARARARPCRTLGPSARTSPTLTCSPARTIGF